MRSLLVAAAITFPFVVGALGASADDREVVFSFQDQEILESSGLVFTEDLVVTTNDSGDAARVFTVDPTTGDTLGIISYDAAARDVEALAPAGNDAVWVGDIGDNLRTRDDISVSLVPIGATDADVEAATYSLQFKSGPRDAESLMAHPVTGRLYVISKTVLGGEFYAAPARLDPSGSNLLKPIGAAPGLVTDAAFFPDGKHLIARNYGRAVVYAFPSLKVVGALRLPTQEQGEGIAVAPDGQVYLSSEGLNSDVLRITLPKKVRTAVDGTPGTGPGAVDDTSPETGRPDASGSDSENTRVDNDAAREELFRRNGWQWLLGGVVGVLAMIVLIRSLKPR